MLKKKTCSEEGCTGYRWKGDKCKIHCVKEYHQLERKRQLNRKQGITKKNREWTNEEMVAFFKRIWKKRVHKSEVSGEVLGRFSTWYFHHILPKSSYPELAFDEENIILLTVEEHEMVERNSNAYEEVARRQNILKEKHINNKYNNA